MSDSKSSRSRVAAHIQSLPRSGIRDFFELVNTMEDVVSLGIGEPDFVTPWGIREAAIYALSRGRTTYTSNLGLLVPDLSAASAVLESEGVTILRQSESCVVLHPDTTGGVIIVLVDQLLPGDPRR